ALACWRAATVAISTAKTKALVNNINRGPRVLFIMMLLHIFFSLRVGPHIIYLRRGPTPAANLTLMLAVGSSWPPARMAAGASVLSPLLHSFLQERDRRGPRLFDRFRIAAGIETEH